MSTKMYLFQTNVIFEIICAIRYHFYSFKSVKTPMDLTLIKLQLLHGCFLLIITPPHICIYKHLTNISRLFLFLHVLISPRFCSDIFLCFFRYKMKLSIVFQCSRNQSQKQNPQNFLKTMESRKLISQIFSEMVQSQK